MTNRLSSQWPLLLRASIIAMVSLWIYWPALHGGWIWDDELYVIRNPLMQDPHRLWKAWFVPGSFVDYYPLQQTVQWVQWQLWGRDTLGYHLTNLVLHVTSALLVWHLFAKLGVRLAWLGGLLFAVHPLQVESVAWIAELKNTLSLPPILLAMCAWIDYENDKRPRDYALALGFFFIALLCKLSPIFLPFILILYTWWRRGRFDSYRATLPFFAIALALGSIPIFAGLWDRQFDHLQADYAPAGGWLGRLVLAGLSTAFCFSKVILPIHLLPVYPRWPVDVAAPLDYLPLLLLAAIIFVLCLRRNGWGRHALLGLGFFLINLAPCPGFIPAPNMGYAWVMDHFLYLPIIGLVGLFVAGLGRLDELIPPVIRLVGVGLLLVIIGLLAWGSRQYAAQFINAETFWTYTLRHNPQAWIAHSDLGVVLKQQGRLAEAVKQDELCLKIRPDYAAAHNNLGNALEQLGRWPEAIAQFHEVLRLSPDSADAHNHLGHALMLAGHTADAMDQFQQALKLTPQFAEARTNLGFVLMQSGRTPEAVDQFQQALEINPELTEPRYDLGAALMALGRLPEAEDQFRQALRIDPAMPDAHYGLGLVLMQSSRVPESIAEFQLALKARPNFQEAQSGLEKAQNLRDYITPKVPR